MNTANPPEPVSPELETLVMRHAAEMDAGNVEAAKDSMRAVLEFVSQDACDNPSPDLVRGLMADRAIDQGDWQLATDYYKEKLREARAEENPSARASFIAQTLLNLASIECWKGQMEAAFQLAIEGLAAAKEEEWDFGTALMAERFAGIALRTGHHEEALHAAEDALSRLENRRSFDLSRAMLILTRCEALRRVNRYDEMRPALDEAWNLLQPLAVMTDASGVQATLGGWWRLEAKWRLRHQNWIGANQAYENAISFLRRVAEIWDCESRRCNAALGEALAEYANAADEHGDGALATQLRFERWQVLRANPGLN